MFSFAFLKGAMSEVPKVLLVQMVPACLKVGWIYFCFDQGAGGSFSHVFSGVGTPCSFMFNLVWVLFCSGSCRRVVSSLLCVSLFFGLASGDLLG